jgi:hypothetical protein
MTKQTDLLTIEDLAANKGHVDALIHSGLLEPHEMKHMWSVIERIENLVKEKRMAEASKP